MNEKVEIQDLYCKWCPQDCKGLTRKEQLGCVASDGFAEELRELGYHKLPTPDSKEYQELNSYRVLLQPRKGYIMLQIPDEVWESRLIGGGE